MKNKKVGILLVVGIVIAFIVGGILASMQGDKVDTTSDGTDTNNKTPITSSEKEEAKKQVENLVIDVWDEKSKENELIKKEIDKNYHYQDIYTDVKVDEKMLDIKELYEMEKRYYDGGYSFDLKHPYNLVMAIEIASKYGDKGLQGLLFKEGAEIVDLDSLIERDESGNAQYFINIVDNSIEYYKLDEKFLTINFDKVINSYLITSIEK